MRTAFTIEEDTEVFYQMSSFHAPQFATSVIAFLKRSVPEPYRSSLGKSWLSLRQLFHKYQTRRLFGDTAHLVPPLGMMHDGPVGYAEFKANGLEFLRFYVELCDLKPHEKMLDVGCGIGRKTLPLISYLSGDGSYDGLDVVKSGIDWCVQKYSREYPNFRFQLVDVFHRHYNPGGKRQASGYTFPFPDEHFDFAVLNSVFTHMMPDEVANYLSEVARVLKPGGRCLISFFLLNRESIGLIEAGKSTQNLRHEFGPARSVSREFPEEAIGYNEPYIIGLYEKSGLQIKQPILYGSWCSRREFFSYQDQILSFRLAG